MQYYLSNIILQMLSQGHRFLGLPAEDTTSCGTPAKLEEFIGKVSTGMALVEPKRRFCFALDDVLVTQPLVGLRLQFSRIHNANVPHLQQGGFRCSQPAILVQTECHGPHPPLPPC